MIEWLTLSVSLLVLIALLCRKGAHRVAADWLLWSFAGFGASAGMLLEAMPFTPVRAHFSLRTVLTIFVGVFAMRLLARGVRAWGLGYRDEEMGARAATARVIHPLIGLGLAVSGVAVLHIACATRQLALEIANTPRDKETGIVRGAEELDLNAESDHAVLMIHGVIGSPADYGDLPDALHDAGLRVHAMLLPGHGTTPEDLADRTQEEWRKAARAAFDELAETHDHVSVVGFSLGGMLASFVAADRPVHRLVLVNPFAGKSATPTWSPFETDSLIRFFAPVTKYVMRTRHFQMLNKRENADRVRAYWTIPVSAGLELQRLAEEFELLRIVEKVDSPTLLLLSEGDNAAPAARGREVFAPLGERLGERFATASFANSDHLLLLDHDAEDATKRIREWLGDAR